MDRIDEELLKEAAAIDAAYAAAELADTRFKVAYLERLLKTLVTNIREDISREQGTEHLWASVEDAEEALGLYDIG